MERVAINKRGATLRLNEAELRLLKNKLNEVTNGIRINDVEFQTRLNGSRADARQLLTEVGDTYRAWHDGNGQSIGIGGTKADRSTSNKAYLTSWTRRTPVEQIVIDEQGVTILLSRAELQLVNSAIREITNGVHIPD